MPFELKLAIKYFRSRRNGLVRFTSVIAVIGIAAGVASLIIANAISRGFSDEIKNKVLNNTSHITVYNEGETIVADWRIIKRKVEQIENVTGSEPTTYESSVISTDANSSYSVLRVKKSEFETQDVENETHISIGTLLAEKLKLKVGDEADIITLENENIPIKSKVCIKEIFETGLFEYDSTWIFINESNFLKLKESKKFVPKVFAVSVKDIYKSDMTATKIRDELGESFKVLDWQTANKPLFAALSLERKVSLAIILIIIFIAILNITTTLSLLVVERKLDIAVLRTCGAKTKNLVAIFLFEGIILSICGIILGTTVGFLACFIGNYFRLIRLSKEVYSLSYIPFNIDFGSVVIVALITFLLSLLAIFYPAVKVSRIKPLENLRLR